MAFDANDLSPHENFVVERTRLGEVADFAQVAPGAAKPPIRAGFLRKLLLELDENWLVRTPGVRIKGARVEGALDLTDCSGAGLPALELVECDIPESMDLSHARLARLNLRGSAFRHLRAHGLVIDGPFDFSFARAAVEGAPCWIDARGAAIAGRIDGEGARLVLEDGLPKDAGAQRYALILREARIGGGVCLRPDFSAQGGATFFDAVVEGLVDLRGAHLKAVGRRALNLGNLRASGVVSLNRGFRAEGPIWMRGAILSGGLNLDGATIEVAAGESEGLNAEHCEIGEELQLRHKFTANALVSFAGSEIHGSVRVDASRITAHPVALDLRKAHIRGELTGAAHLTGALALSGASIGGNCDLRGVEIAVANGRAGSQKPESAVALDAASVRIGGAALLQGANVKGEVFLADARIEGYLALGGGRFIHPGHWAIRAPNARIGGNLTLKIDESSFAPHGQKTVIEGGAKFDRAQIDGAFTWLNLELRGPGPDNAKGALLSLANAKIAGPLQARALVAQADARIDLSGVSCATLDDDLKAGWGADGAALDLEGFAYQRIENAGERWRDRLAWLKRSRRDGARFSPQPFTRAADVYARAGRREDARRILLAQQDLYTRRASAGPLTWLLSSLFGLTAGYGLAPIRIARALVLFFALGVAGTLAMNAQGALVRPSGAACEGAIEPALYAIDVALPVIDLGQETRCAPGRTARAELGAGVELPHSDWRLLEGAALWKWAQALYAILGAILTALAVITFSGVMKPKDD